jgi:short-subunit dehydrogenase
VVAVARNPVEDFPADAAWIQGDVSSVEGVQAIVEQTSAILGGVDILVNNAASGRIYPGGSVTIPDSGWQDFNRNFFSAVRLTAALLPGMLERKSGAIVNISSGAALTTPNGAMIHYSSAKAAMNAWSKTLATEVAPHGVRVNTVTSRQRRDAWSGCSACRLYESFWHYPGGHDCRDSFAPNGHSAGYRRDRRIPHFGARRLDHRQQLIVDGGQNPTV